MLFFENSLLLLGLEDDVAGLCFDLVVLVVDFGQFLSVLFLVLDYLKHLVLLLGYVQQSVPLFLNLPKLSLQFYDQILSICHNQIIKHWVKLSFGHKYLILQFHDLQLLLFYL